mmetsp:Transcript_17435/g.47652  ORF Transcript_17435/g.47652 Transcript_17435/m.47652 type:complete len:221 (+) Transcript_17435:1051-1713(+)
MFRRRLLRRVPQKGVPRECHSGMQVGVLEVFQIERKAMPSETRLRPRVLERPSTGEPMAKAKAGRQRHQLFSKGWTMFRLVSTFCSIPHQSALLEVGTPPWNEVRRSAAQMHGIKRSCLRMGLLLRSHLRDPTQNIQTWPIMRMERHKRTVQLRAVRRYLATTRQRTNFQRLPPRRAPCPRSQNQMQLSLGRTALRFEGCAGLSRRQCKGSPRRRDLLCT